MADLAADHLPVTPALEAACRALGTTPKLADAALLRCARAGIRAERGRISQLARDEARRLDEYPEGWAAISAAAVADFADLIEEETHAGH